ncbi:MAG: transglycosylase domain-containing protein [Deltaproteobacteria bacterium]|nr:transglycosylase domain-containing protein [Deltaproteobacteria bacterium]
MFFTGPHRILIATAVLAAGVPLGAAQWIDARRSDLTDELGTAAGVPVRIVTVDADLTGSVRLSDVAFGELIAADSIEASVALDSLLAGELRADEIRVSGPRVSLNVGVDGDSDLSRLVHRLARRRESSTGSAGRVRRIVVSSGTLTARIAGVGELTAHGVELVPDADGVRVTTGRVRIAGATHPIGVELAFARSAAELSLPSMKFRRVLAVGGTGTVSAGARTIALREVAAGRLAPAGALEVRAAIDDAGIARPVSLEVSPHDLSVTVRGDRVPLRGLAAIAPRGLGLDDARATGELHIRKGDRAIEITADGSFDGVSLDHRSLATEPIAVTATIRTTLSIAPDAITVQRLGIDTGAIHTTLTGWVRRGSPASGQVDVELASAPCAELLASLPAAIRGPLDGMVLDGSLGGRARLTIDLAAPTGDGTVLTTEVLGHCTTLAEPPAADVMALTRATPHVFVDGSRGIVGPGEESWFDLRQMPTRLHGAFTSAEDGRFWDHGGFDVQQIARSLEIDLRERRLARGGSTISQQLIKNAFLTHRRTLDRKLQEAVLTWRLEARLEKKQILERYLNIIELGPRVFGVGAAAKHWFGVTPRGLTVRQAAFLAALTSEPTSMARRVRRHGGLDPDSAERVATVLRAMRRDGVIDTEEYETARDDGLHFESSALRDH